MQQFVDINTKKILLRNQSCFLQLMPEEMDELAGLLVEKRFSAGQIIVREGEPVDGVYLVVRGTVEVRDVVPREMETIQTLTVGDSIGLNEVGFYSPTGDRTATVVAQTDVLVLWLTVAAFHNFALGNPHVNELMQKHCEMLLQRQDATSGDN